MPPAAGVAIEYEALPGRVRFAAGAISTIPEETKRLGARRVVLIDGLLDPTLAEGVATALGACHAATLTVARQHVPEELAEQAGRIATDAAADCLLSIGGGSSLGVAKAVALRTGLPIVAVPTTYAGSEMTPIWGLTAGGHKTTGLAELGLDEAGADAAAETIARSAPAQPMAVSGDEVRTILERAMRGPRQTQLLRQPEGEGDG